MRNGKQSLGRHGRTRHYGHRNCKYKLQVINKFREYILRISETVDDRRPIRKELSTPDDPSKMHNKWTFPTSLLYVLTVLTTCGTLWAQDNWEPNLRILSIPHVFISIVLVCLTGYGEVSVDTRFGKIFSVSFAFLGIPLMFITAADIGKFLSETLTKLKDQGKRFKRKLGVSSFCYILTTMWECHSGFEFYCQGW